MNEKKPVFSTEAMSEAYEKLLKLSMKEFKLLEEKTGPVLHKLIDKTSEKLSELDELSKEEAQKISAYLKRDLKEAADYMAESGEEFQKWLAIDADVIENYLYDYFKQAADQTTVELAQLKKAAEHAPYHTGEITGPGVLICDECGEQLHFKKAGHIPPCAKCKGTYFHRLICK